MPSQTLLIDGIPFHTLLEGPPNSPLVFLVHALMSNHHMWDSLCPILHKAGYQTLRYDHVGHNLTLFSEQDVNGGRRKLHCDDYTRHMHDILQVSSRNNPDFTGEPHAIIGCSLGGVLAIRYALLYPNSSIRNIISCDAPGLTSLDASKPKWAARIQQWREEGSNENLAHATVQRWFPDPCPEGVRETALAQVVTCSLPGYIAGAEALMNFDYTEQLEEIR